MCLCQVPKEQAERLTGGPVNYVSLQKGTESAMSGKLAQWLVS